MMPNSFTLRDLAMRGLPPQARSPLMPDAAPDLIGPPMQQQAMPPGWANAPMRMPTQAGTHPAFLRPTAPMMANPQQPGGQGMMPADVAAALQFMFSQQR